MVQRRNIAECPLAGNRYCSYLADLRQYAPSSSNGSNMLKRRLSYFLVISNAYTSTSRPCFSTTLNNRRAIPLGRFWPVSHFWTVDSLVFK